MRPRRKDNNNGITAGSACHRAERRTWRRRHYPNRWPANTDDELEESTLVIVRQWTFDGAGWLTNGDAALAASAAARAREYRELAREAQDTDQDHEP